jgi:hypothetical protein
VKGAIKQGVVAYTVLRERASEMGETMSDLLAEAQVELATESTGEADSESKGEPNREARHSAGAPNGGSCRRYGR